MYWENNQGTLAGFLIRDGVFHRIDSGFRRLDIMLNGISETGDMAGFSWNYNTFEIRPIAVRLRKDTDGDGLLDYWETSGITVGEQFLNLPAMGADPMHKDIFVEVDYMMDDTHSHAFSPAAQEIVMEMFQNAPVQNPDGTTGINIHIDAGRASVMNPATRERWGDLSQSDALGHENTIGRVKASDGSYDMGEFQNIKRANFAPLRASSFHYAMFAHDLGGLGDTSGIGETWATT